MADPVIPPVVPPVVPPVAPPVVWHAGVEADTIGFWQNKGIALDDPKVVFGELSKQYRALEKHVGAPPDRLIRLPEKPDDAAGWNGVYQRLGVPAEAKDYDFAGVKRADGKDVDPALSDMLRTALLAARVPKDRGADVLKAVVKSLDDAKTQETAVLAGKIAEEKATLAKNWGPNFDFNHLKAMEGVRRSGMTREGVQAMENAVGYAAVMEHFRRIGASTSEDVWREGDGPSGGTPTTLEGAQARLDELTANKDWGKRLRAQDPATVAEYRALTSQIAAAA